MLITRPMRCGPAARATIDWPMGRIMPPPRPCRTRNTINELADHATPHRQDPMTNSETDVIHINFVPKRSTAQPVTGMTTAKASRYPVVTHWMVETDTWKSRASVSRATATIVVSRIAMIDPSTMTVETRRISGVRTESWVVLRAMQLLSGDTS